MEFQLRSDFEPTGDQPEAIKSLVQGINEGRFRPNAPRSNRVRKNLYHGECHQGS